MVPREDTDASVTTLAGELRRLRVASGLTLLQLARELSLPQSVIVSYEKGQILPQESSILAYERTLGVTGGSLQRLRKDAHSKVMSGSGSQRAYEFEREVAALFSSLGAERTSLQVSLAGVQIDVLVEQLSVAGDRVRTIVECKAYDYPVQADEVRSFAAILDLLRQRDLAESAAIVSQSGFSSEAYETATELTLELVLMKYGELQDRVRNLGDDIRHEYKGKEQSDLNSVSRSQVRKIFVLMPFAPEYEDLYVLGIREVAEKAGFVVERADEIEHNMAIVAVVREKIAACDIIIAETTSRNANVYYELGYADGIHREAVLLTRVGNDPPFDIRERNHIMYSSIVDLRVRLERRLRDTAARLESHS